MVKLHGVVIVHHLVIVLAIFSMIGAFVTAPLPVATGICIVILRICTSPAPCILTIVENRLRRIHGLPQIGGFIKHYYVTPLRKLLRR